MHGLLGGLPHARYKTAYQGRESYYASGHRHLLHQPLYRKDGGTDCGACSEHCPTQAVHMVPYEGTLTIPQVNPDLCIGCGGCESICPVRPMRAIIIKANEVHKFVEKPKEEEVKKVEIDDFGF